MKRAALVLIAGIVLIGAGAPTAMARTDVPFVVEQGDATLKDILELGKALRQVKATIRALETDLVSGNITREDKQECSFNEMNTKVDWTNREERRTAFCVVRRWSVPGGLSQFISVGDCESGWWRFAYNDNGHAGLFQHDTDSWPYRVNAYEPQGWDLKEGWMNSRSQIVVSARMAHNDGDWGQWAGCA